MLIQVDSIKKDKILKIKLITNSFFYKIDMYLLSVRHDTKKIFNVFDL